MQLHSYKSVFDFERRIYRIDSLRLNPSGVPLRGIAYFLMLVLAALVLAALPSVGPVVDMVPWYVRGLIVPGSTAAVLTIVRIDGRPFHLAAFSLLRTVPMPWARRSWPRAMPRGLRWRPGDVVVVPDGSDSRLCRLRYTGPGTVRVALADARPVLRPSGSRLRWIWGSAPSVLQLSASEGHTAIRRIELAPGARLEVVP